MGSTAWLQGAGPRGRKNRKLWPQSAKLGGEDGTREREPRGTLGEVVGGSGSIVCLAPGGSQHLPSLPKFKGHSLPKLPGPSVPVLLSLV